MDLRILGIDWQNDFVDPNGSLYVPGADEDAVRCAAMIERLMSKITDFHATLDSHHSVDIAHPIFWINSSGQNPAPFTTITVEDVEDGIWRAYNPADAQRAKAYVQALKDNNRYELTIWPPHCLIGSWGTGVYPAIYEQLLVWEQDFAMVDYVTKGSNLYTEHYSAVQADVPDPSDPGTMLNAPLIQTLQEADIIALTGQALSHCLANTVKDIADKFGEENIKKLVLIRDCTSNVAGCDQMGEDFINEMTARGMQISTSIEFLA